jgi:hypothetical protein
LSKFGQLRSGNKSDLIQYLQDIEPIATLSSTDVLLIDRAAFVNMLQRRATRTFQEYADEVFVPYRNFKESILCGTDTLMIAREARGKGKRRRVAAQTCLPGKWSLFFRNEKYKLSCSVFWLKNLQSTILRKILYQHKAKEYCRILLCPCNNKDADTRLFLHLSDVSKGRYKSV